MSGAEGRVCFPVGLDCRQMAKIPSSKVGWGSLHDPLHADRVEGLGLPVTAVEMTPRDCAAERLT